MKKISQAKVWKQSKFVSAFICRHIPVFFEWLRNAWNLSTGCLRDVAFLVVGDPFGATTHADLLIRARELGIETKVIHNASVMNAVGACGLQLYNFGQTISLVFFTDTWKPDSFYDKLKVNKQMSLHTLCLLDIKVKEQSLENMARGRLVYEPPRYMTVNQALEQLLEIEEIRNERAYTENSICVGIARLGADSQRIVAGTMRELVRWISVGLCTV